MKKIISLLLVTLFLVVACPVFATDATPTVSISTVANGDTYAVGAAVALMVETNVADADIKNIDFYANGIKIPGTVTSATKSVIWTPEAVGSYALTAKVTTKTDGEVPTASAVTVDAVDSSSKFIVTYGDNEVENGKIKSTYNSWGDVKDSARTTANTEYVKLSKYSAVMGPFSSSAKQMFNINDIGADIGTTSARKYTHINYSVYSNNAISVKSTLADSTGVTSPECWISFKEGWNTVSVSINDSYRGTTLSDIDVVIFTAAGGYGIPSGFINAGTKLNEQPNYADTSFYFDAVWLSNGAATAPVAKPSIPDGQQNVCNELKKYTITFDQAMLQSTLVKENITIKDAENEDVAFAVEKTTPNAMVLSFTNDFEYEGVYTVSLSKNIASAFGVSVGENVSFDFSIVTSCETADPILSMTYPKNGATVASNNATLAAKVIFDGNVNAVEFYNSADDTKIGDATKGSDGEYYLVKDDFTAGECSVYAKVTYNDSSTLDTKLAPATFTVAEAISYAISGVADGEKIAVNSGAETVLSRTVGLSTTEKVSKVIYKIDGVEKETVTVAPFTWDMPITDVNTHTLSAVVYDTMGSKQTVTGVTYNACYLTTSNKLFDNFDNTTIAAWDAAKYGDISTVNDPLDKGHGSVGSLAYTGYNKGASGKGTCLYYAGFAIPASKEVQIDCDLYVPNFNSELIWMDVRPTLLGGTGVKVYDLSAAAYSNAIVKNDWNSIRVVLDFSQNGATTFSTFVNGTLIETKTTSGTGFDAKNEYYIHFRSQAAYYLDNISVNDLTYLTSATEPLVDKVTFTDKTTSWDADFIVTNLTGDAKECTVFYAVYDANDNLIAVNGNGEKVDLAAGAIAKKSYSNISKTYGDKTGTKIRGFVWESVSGVTTLRPLGELK